MSGDSLIGRQLDEYRLEKLLGHGGMARVYRGADVKLKRHVAIKVIDAQFRSDSDYARRFELEAQAIAQLEHPNIVAIYRYGDVGGLLYMAMQYVEGSDLYAVLESYRKDGEFMAAKDLLRVLRNVADALDYAHSKGVVHRDIKPSNIMLNTREQAIVTDFGLALLTDVGTRGEILGSPHYIAPEQAISSRNALPQSDMYALGVIIYEALAGVLPFDAPEPLDVAMMHISEPPPPLRQKRPELTAAVEAVVLKALAKEPKDRYPSCGVLVDELEKALVGTVAVPTAPGRFTVAERVGIYAAANPLPVIDSKPSGGAQPTPGARPLPPQPPKAYTPPPAKAVVAPAAQQPQAVAQPTPAPVAPAPKPTEQKQTRMWLLAGFLGLLLVALTLGAGALFFGPMLGLTQAKPSATPEVAVTVTLAQTRAAYPGPQSTPTALPTDQPSPTSGPTAVPTTPAPTPIPPTPVVPQRIGYLIYGPVLFKEGAPNEMSNPDGMVATVAPTLVSSYQISIITTNKDDGLFVKNVGTVALPLDGLTLKSGKVTILGAGWDLDSLAPGACVAVWKNKGTPQLPTGETCNLVGKTQGEIKINDLWSPALTIIFDKAEIKQCQKGLTCEVTFP